MEPLITREAQNKTTNNFLLLEDLFLENSLTTPKITRSEEGPEEKWNIPKFAKRFYILINKYLENPTLSKSRA